MGATLFLASFSLLGGDGPAGPTSSAAPDVYVLKRPYRTEQEWIIGSICRNAFELLSFIVDRKGEIITPDQVSVKKIEGDKAAYDVTVHAKKVTVNGTLHFPGSIWSSQAYVPFCEAVMNQLKVDAPTSRTSKGNPLGNLLDFSESSIEAENVRISQWLSEEPDNTLAQQQAALLLGTLAMKENSGWFWDPRDICNQATAHLAVAYSLNSGTSLVVEGQLAECLVGLIADTKKECAKQLDRMTKITRAPKELGAWLRAARMRNSRDWRLVDKPEKGSGLEQVEYFRALCEAVSSDQAIRWIEKSGVRPRQDWTRIVLEFSFSVDAGHVYASPSVGSELALMQATFPNRFNKDSFIVALNETPAGVLMTGSSGASTLRVISNGMWAQFLQRHFCHALVETGDFLQNKWGVQDQADQFETATSNAFSQLCLFPYLRGIKAIRLKRPNDPEAIAAAFAQHPEWAQPFVDEIVRGDDPFLISFRNTVRTWFSPPILNGTAYSAFARLEYLAADLKNRSEAIHKLYEIAPLQYRVAELELISRYSEHPTYTQVQQIMGPMLDYYLPALNWAAKASDLNFDDRITLQKKAAALDPQRYRALARDFLSRGRASEAAATYQQWFDKGTDRIAVSNEMEWLVNYYYDHGQKGKAMAIAKYCAGVYSWRGLTTMLNLLLRMGEFDQAEEYGRKIQERYHDSGPLIAFYRTMAAKGDAGFKAKFDASVREVFPAGLKSVTLSSFARPPQNGMRFYKTSATMAANGLSSDQVVVALDGYQTENVAQYEAVRSFSDSPGMAFIVWDGHAYREVKAHQPGRRFGVDIVNYTH